MSFSLCSCLECGHDRVWTTILGSDKGLYFYIHLLARGKGIQKDQLVEVELLFLNLWSGDDY